MIDKSSQFFAILTAVGEAKHANAIAMGLDWMFTEMGLGDANGTDPIPDRLQTRLINEWRRAPINQIRVDPANPSTVITEQIIPPEVGGEWIREIGLYDVDGDLVAVANCAPSYKPLLAQGSGKTQVVRMNFIVSSSANIVLKIDPAVVLATREYVDLAIVEALAKLDPKQSVLVATTAPITLENTQSIDGVALLVDDRVLVKDQEQAQDNGLYLVASGTWTRAADADASVEVTPGLFVPVERGTVNGDSVWQLVSDGPIILDTTALQFEMIAGRSGVNVGTYRSVSVDARGRVIAGTNPTTLDEYGITDALAASKNLVDVEDVAEARDNLGLGSAATHDAQTSLTDATLDRLMKVGAFGLGVKGPIVVDLDALLGTQFFGFRDTAVGAVPGTSYDAIGWQVEVSGQRTQFGVLNSALMIRTDDGNNVWSDWVQVWDSKTLIKQESNTDTTAGRVLLSGAFGLGGAGISLPAGTDLNAVRTAGFYRIQGTPVNGPVDGGNSIMIVGSDADATLQHIVKSNTGVSYTRGGGGSGSTWSAWKTQWDNGSLVKQANVTDATAGHVLLNGAFGLGGVAPGLPGNDFNAAQVGGTYTYEGSTLNRPNVFGAGTVGMMTHAERSFGNLAFQEAWEKNGKIFNRFRTGDFATGTWSTWQLKWDSTNLVKQASEDDDTPGCVLLAGAYGWGQGGIILANGTDLDTITAAGVYRVQEATDHPSGIQWSPMLVMAGQDTVVQMSINNQTGTIYSRGCINGDPGWGPWVTNWNTTNFNPAAYQSALGFTPVQQGTAPGQLTNTVKIGWTAFDACNVTVDDYDLGAMWTDNIGAGKVRAAIASFAAGEVGTYGLFRAYNGAGLVPGSWTAGINLQYTDASATSAHGSPAGTWQLMGGLNNADGQTADSVSVWLRVA